MGGECGTRRGSRVSKEGSRSLAAKDTRPLHLLPHIHPDAVRGQLPSPVLFPQNSYWLSLLSNATHF